MYVLINPKISDLVKIGFTRRSPRKRAKELSGSWVPGEYKVAHKVEVGDPEKVERRVHTELSNQRVRGGEFFEVEPERAVQAIRKVM